MPKKKPEKTDLHIYDFDQTLFHSPAAAPGRGARGRHFHEPGSLSDPHVPSEPNEEWWLPEIVQSFQDSKKNPKNLVVIMTGRSEPLRPEVERLLKQKNLDPDELVMKESHSAKDYDKRRPTNEYKVAEMKRLLAENPKVKNIHFWEDRHEHLQEFQQAAEAEGYTFVPHPVPRRDPYIMWEEFLGLYYDGGKKPVRNTNRETQKEFPTVQVDTLLKTDPNFRERLHREFQRWWSQGRPGHLEGKDDGNRVHPEAVQKTSGSLESRVTERFLRSCLP